MRLPSTNQIKHFLTIFVLVIFGFFLIKFHKELYVLREISFQHAFGLFFLVLLKVAVNGSKLRSIIASFGTTLKFKEWFGLASITTTLNHFLFKSGSLVTSNYLNRAHGLSYMSFLGSFAADQLIKLLIVAVVGSVFSGYLLITTSGNLGLVTASYIFIALVLFLLLKGTFNLKNQEHSILDAIVRGINSLGNILKNKRLFYTLCAHNIALISLTSVRFFVVCKILNLDISISYCFLFTTIVQFVSVVPLFHSDIGARELAVGLFSGLVGIGFNEGLLATLVDRLLVLFCVVLLAGIFKNILISAKPKREKQEA